IKLIKQISDHLSVSYFRYKFGIYHGNPLTDHIKQEYDSIFKLTNIACDLIRNELELPVHEGEVALITLHFSSYLERKIFDDTIVVLDIVCPSGISTSNMLYTELINLHSFIKVNKVMGIEQYHNEGSSSEYIVSTIPLEQEVKHIVVNPILTNADKKNILNTLNLQVDTPNNVAVDDLMLLINPYIKPGMKEYTKKTLLNYFSRDETYKSKRLGMLDILYNENIIVSDEKVSWKDAVNIGSSPLINNKSIEPSYIEAMINNTIKFGPYMVLENGYVLMHANYVDGVNNLAISFTKFNHSIKIKNKQFNKLIILAPIDEKKHIDIMKDLMLLFTDEDIHHKLDEADSSEAIKEVLKELSNDKES
ncbi:MAG: PTS transporter subunit EIIA, partial [Erysipelothrix sp.]|nr:PTS transporter subunit EIIA [Erysipelothrix sp.]